MPENLSDYFKFGFIRNPWYWHVSKYFYFRRSPVVEAGLLIGCDAGLKREDFTKKFPTFKDHMLWGDSECPNFWLSYVYRDMYFVDGRDMLDYVGSCENKERSVNEIFKRCNIIPKISWQDFYRDTERKAVKSTKDMPKGKIFWDTVHEHYSHYYDQELIDLVYKKDKEIIDRFNYKYEVREEREWN